MIQPNLPDMEDSSDVPLGYKRTEVGVVPEAWETTELGNLIDYTKGYAFKSSEYASDGTRIIRVSDTTYDSILEVNPVFVVAAKAELYAKWALKENDLVISTVGSKPPMYDSMVGKVILIQQSYKGALLNQNAVLIRDKKRRAHFQHILLGHFRTKRYLAFIESIYRGNANQASITLKELFQFWVPIPSLDTEQRAIAEALSDVDQLLGALEALIEKKRAIKQGAMQQLLTGKTRLTDFSGPWTMKRMAELAAIDPENLPANTKPEFAFNYISLEQVEAGRLLGFSTEVFSLAPSRARRVLRDGDVLMSTVRPNLLAHFFYHHQVPNAVCSTGFAVLRAKPKVSDPGFLFGQLFGHVVNEQIEKTLAGSNYPAISSRDVGLIEVPCPPTVQEQAAIANVLSDIDAEIKALEDRRDKTRAIKQGMMQQLLTGRIRLVKPQPAEAEA